LVLLHYYTLRVNPEVAKKFFCGLSYFCLEISTGKQMTVVSTEVALGRGMS